LGATVEFFAYPNGDYNTKIENIINEGGYGYAFTTLDSINTKINHRFNMGRSGFTYEPFYLFQLRMAGIYEVMNAIKNGSRNAQCWLPGFIINRTCNHLRSLARKKPTNVYLSICDHFEPLLGGASFETGLKRVREWIDKYPKIADMHRDSDGILPKYTFFFPVEEYEPDYLTLLGGLCRKGYGEVEIHLHHDNDTPENFKNTIIQFKNILSKRHNLLCRDKESGEIAYGFIHGDWALDNSRPDGRMCGLNNEVQILQETGCYADFTMPSVPDVTQSRIVNSIYYSVDDPKAPKSYNRGSSAKKGKKNYGLLMVQGPLMLNWKNKKFGILPHIENGAVSGQEIITTERLELWIDANIHVEGESGAIFIKLHSHGCHELNAENLLNKDLDYLFTLLESRYNDGTNFKLHYVSAREMVNIIKAIEDGHNINESDYRNYRYIQLAS